VVVRVTDMDGKYDRQTFTLTVENVNDPPTLQPIDELTITEDMAFQYQVVVTDVDLYDELTYYDDSNLFDIDSETGIISFIPENDDVGTYIILISVSDLQGDTDDEVFTLNIENANDPPVLDFITGMIAFEDEFFSFTATASDVDVGDSCTFSDNTTLLNIEPNSGEVSFTPTNADVGIHVINISVFDQYGYFDYQEIVIIVENVNDPPVIPDTVKNDLSRDIEMTVGDSFTYTIIVDDVDADDEVTFSDDTDLFDINPTTGEIAFAPTSEDAGTHTVTITVTDSEGKEDHITLTFSIADEKEEEDRDTTMMTILLVIPIVVVVILLVLLLSKKKKQGGPPVAEPVEFIEFELQNEPSEEQAGQVFAPMVPLEHDTLPPPPGFPPQQ
jgi:hypothetical protein